MMNAIRTLCFHLLIVAACGSGCSRSAPFSYTDYSREVAVIRQRAVDLTATSDLLQVTNFLALYETPQNCMSNAVSFLKDPSNSDETKMIVVYSLQKLALDQYVAFGMQLLEMSRRRELSKDFLNRAIFPGLEWSTKLQKHYQTPCVKELLNAVVASEAVNEANKKYARDISSGKVWEQILELEGSGVPVNRND